MSTSFSGTRELSPAPAARHRPSTRILFFIISIVDALALAEAQRSTTHRGRPFVEWVGLLRDEDPVRRREAAAALASAPPLPAELARPLFEILFRSGNTEAVSAANAALQHMGPAAADLVPDLMAILRYETKQQVTAAGVLTTIGKPAVPELVAALRTAALQHDESAASWHRSALSQMGRDAAPAVGELLRSTDPWVRELAAVTLAQMGPRAAPARQALERSLCDPSDRVRTIAARVMADLPEGPSPDAFLSLVDALRDRSSVVRTRAAEALGLLHSSSDVVVPALIERLDDREPAVRTESAVALGRFRSAAEPAVAKLSELIADQDWRTRDAAVTALGWIGPAAAPAVPKLHQELHAHLNAIWALGQIGPAARQAAADLIVLVDHADNAVLRARAAEALGGVQATEAVAPLRAALLDPDRWVRIEAAKALGKIGNAAGVAVPDLLDVVACDDPALVGASAQALGSLGRDRRRGIRILREIEHRWKVNPPHRPWCGNDHSLEDTRTAVEAALRQLEADQ